MSHSICIIHMATSRLPRRIQQVTHDDMPRQTLTSTRAIRVPIRDMPICIIHVATSLFSIQRLLAWHISTSHSNSSLKCQGLPRHIIMCNLLDSTWKSRSDSGEHWKGGAHSWEHWKGAPPFASRQCFPNKLCRAFKIYF